PEDAWFPRLAFCWAPFAAGRTRLAGGYAITYDAVNLGMLGRPFDQTAATTHYNPGGTPAVSPAITTFTLGKRPLELPGATNWTLSLDHRISEHLYATAKYLRRRSNTGFTFANALGTDVALSESPLPNAVFDGIYQLTNLRRDSFDQVEFSVRHTFMGQYEWMTSYVYSRALSNAVLDINATDPLQVIANLRPMPWDVPHR